MNLKALQRPNYKENVLNTVEILYIWVIERKKLLQESPFMKADLNVIWTDDIEPFMAGKVRIFNGAVLWHVCLWQGYS